MHSEQWKSFPVSVVIRESLYLEVFESGEANINIHNFIFTSIGKLLD
jgi:hypothetical protein